MPYTAAWNGSGRCPCWPFDCRCPAEIFPSPAEREAARIRVLKKRILRRFLAMRLRRIKRGPLP